MPTVPANGIRLAVRTWGAGRTLLLISGIGYGAWYWRLLGPRLARGRRVAAYDPRGVGDSERPPGPYTTALLAADAAALLDALGGGPADVLGHSLGGMVAQELALARPDLVGRMVLAATTHGGPEAVPVTPAALEVLRERDGDPLELFHRGMEVSTGPGFTDRRPDVIADLLAYRMSAPVDPPGYAAALAAGSAHDATERLPGIRCPTLVVTGAEDRVVPPRNAELIAARIPGARVVVLPGLGHHFPLEDPDLTARTLLAFLGDAP